MRLEPATQLPAPAACAVQKAKNVHWFHLRSCGGEEARSRFVHYRNYILSVMSVKSLRVFATINTYSAVLCVLPIPVEQRGFEIANHSLPRAEGMLESRGFLLHLVVQDIHCGWPWGFEAWWKHDAITKKCRYE